MDFNYGSMEVIRINSPVIKSFTLQNVTKSVNQFKRDGGTELIRGFMQAEHLIKIVKDCTFRSLSYLYILVKKKKRYVPMYFQ